MAYKIGNRRQITFFPPTIDEYIGSEDPVRVYDAFVDALNIEELGISVRCDKAAGAHEYYPGLLQRVWVVFCIFLYLRQHTSKNF